MTDIIAALVLVLIVGAAALYVRREKKRGVKCIGCPAGGCSGCSGSCGGASACGCHTDDAK